jgi:perosamine synthetase
MKQIFNSRQNGKSKSMETLAIFGGDKVRRSPMPARKAFGPDEIAAVNEAITYYNESESDPPYQGKFEQSFCEAYVELMGGGYADAVATGTGSVFVALEALQLPRGSEVIISPFCDAGPFNCILYLGCVPVVADAAPDSYNAGVEQFVDKITEKTNAIIAVHSAGDPLEIDRLVEEMHQKGIKVLEDCSQSPGALFKEQRVGTFGDISATSTMYRKTLTAGASGGIVFTKDIDLYHRALACADRGKPIWKSDYDFRSPGGHLFPALNWNTDELSCAIGLSSIRRLDAAIQKRMRFVRQLERELSETSTVCKAYSLPKGASPFFLPIWVEPPKLDCNKLSFAKAVQAEGIDLNPDYNFLISDWHWAAAYVPNGINTPNAKKTRDRSFNLFLNEKYGTQEVLDIITAIKKVEKVYCKN